MAPESPEESTPVGHLRVDAQNPWPGLEAYDEASSEFFCGRSTEAAELLRLIRLAPLTVVYGKSGLGKTSLLQAGLFPLLRAQHYLPVLLRLDFAGEIKNPPLEQVKQCLRESLDRAKVEYPTIGSDESLWEYLHRKDAEFWSVDNFPLTPVLVFDQFEELFSRTGGNVELIGQVFDGMADLIENRIPAELASETAGSRRSRLDLLSQRYCIVLSFREDFVPEIRTWEKQVPSLLRNYLRLEPMSRECAIKTVEQSGKTVLEDGVAPWIVDLVGKRDHQSDASDASDMVVEPVLLSLCCTQLNRRRAPDSRIDKNLVETAGLDILESFYRDALKDPEVKGEPDVARFIEDYLIQGDHFRGDYPKQEALDDHKLRSEQLGALTNRHRLLRIVYRGDTARIELIHDRLVPVVRKSRDQRRIQARQEEQERRAREAQEERDKERARSEQLKRQRDVATRLRNIAVAATIASLALAGWALYEKRLKERVKLSEEIAVETGRLAEGRLALQVGSEPLEQTMYRALAAYRLSSNNEELAQARAASLSALELVLDTSGHLGTVVRLKGVMPTPALEFSPDGKTLAVGGEDGAIRLLDAKDYHLTGILDCHQLSAEAVWSLDFNGDGTRLAAGYSPIGDSATGSGLVCVFDVQQRSIVQKWSSVDHGRGHASVYSVVFGGKPGMEFVIFGGGDKLFRKLEVNTGDIVEVKNPGPVVAIAINADGSKVATGSEDGIIRVWKMADLGNQNEQPMELKGHVATIEQVVFSPADPAVLVSAGDDGRIIAWNVEDGCRTQQSDIQDARIYNVAITRPGTMLAAAGVDGYVRLFGLSNSNMTCDKPLPSGKSSAAPKPQKIELLDEGVLSGHGGVVLAVAFDPEANHLASAGQDGSIRIWVGNTGSFSLAHLELDSPLGSVTAVAVSPDAKSVAAGDDNGYIRVWELPTENGEPTTVKAGNKWKAHEKAIRSLTYVRIGDQLGIVSGGDDGVLKRWDASSREVIGSEMAEGAKPVLAIAPSPDGRMLAAGSPDGTVRLWDTATGKLVRTIDPPKGEPDYKLSAVGFSNDGRYLAIGSPEYQGLRVVDLTYENKERTLQGHRKGVASISRGEKEWLLSADMDGSILEWEAAAMTQPETQGLRKRDEFKYREGFRELRQPQPLTAMDTSTDGRLILTGGDNGQIQLWDGVEHVLISDHFTGKQEAIRAVAVAPNGSFFVTADASKILVWPGPDRWADIVCSKLLWNMSREQWNKWAPDIPYREQCPGLAIEPAEASKGKQ